MKRPGAGLRVATAALVSLLGAGAWRRAEGRQLTNSGVPRRVALDAGGCPAISAPALRRIVAIEIGDLLVGPTETISDDTDRLVISCTGAVARVEADGPGRPRPLERMLRLDDFPGDAAPRALALAGIEILAALSPDVRQRIEARQGPPAPAPPPPAPAAVQVRAAPPAPRPRQPSTTVVAAAVRRSFLAAHGVSAWGGRLGVRRDLGTRWELGADGELVGGTVAGPLGNIASTLGSAGVVLGLHGGTSRLAGAVGLGGRAGLARLQGQPAAGVVGDRALRPWGGPVVCARAASSRGWLGIELAAELGFNLGTASGSADGVTVVAVGGPWLLLSAGVATRF